MKKFVKFIPIFMCLLLININHTLAKTEVEVESDCKKGSACVISNDIFSFKIKSVELYDNQNKKLETISDFTINPKVYKVDESDLKTTEVTEINMQVLLLNMDIPNLKDIVKKYKNNVFIGYIVINYETNFEIDDYKYTYKISALDNNLKNDTLPSTGQYKHFFVTLDKDDNFYMDDYFFQSDETSISSGSLTLMYFLSNSNVSSNTFANLFDEDNFIFFIANDDGEAGKSTIEDDGKDFATYYDRDHEINEDANIIDTQEEGVPQEKSGENVPPTSVWSITTIIILIILSVVMFIYANKKIFKGKI